MRRSVPRLGAPFAWADVAYAPGGGPSHALDVAIPRAPRGPAARLPACVFVHGGAWQRGDKRGALNRGVDAALAARGLVGVAANYRLSPAVRHPEHARDVAAAVAWLHGNVAKFGGDPERIVLVGHSAGAHLVMQVLADPRLLRDAGLDRPVEQVVKAAVGISGVYNVVRTANATVYGELVTNPAFGERVEAWRKASIVPVLMEHGEDAPLTRIPVMLVTAEQDFHFEEDALELETWLRNAGHKSVQRHVIPGKNHFSIIRDLTEDPEDETMALVAAFAKEQCGFPP